MLALNNVTLRIAGRVLLDEVSLQIPQGARVGLVGRNGTGKTSLLRLIAGELQPDAGDISLAKGMRMAMVAQEAPSGAASVLETVLAADRERAELLLEAEHTTDPMRIAEVQTRLADIGAHRAEAKAASILKGLGFSDAAQERSISSFSGGWRMRAALAATLFLEPDILLLDEPTNHLDLEATMWLQEHLRTYPYTLLMVSHDRDLLNYVPRQTAHLQARKLTVYAGGYDDFERVLIERQAQDEKSRQKQEAQRAHMQAFIDRFRYKASKARQAQSRIKALARIGSMPDAVVEATVRFAFPEPDVPPPPLITLNRVSVGYGDVVVLDQLNLRIDPDDRIALLGANGNGKSTFAKLIAGRLEPRSGETTRAPKLRVGFFAQHQIEELVLEIDAIAHVQARRPQDRVETSRAYLGRFGIGAELAKSKVGNLSGGEKTRLALSLCCLDAPQILILDEPTNHLDIASTEALASALNAFAGAVILITHDRHLVALTVDRLWLVASGTVRSFEGDLADYHRLLMETSSSTLAKSTAGSAPARKGKASGTQRRQALAPLRKRVQELESDLKGLLAEKAVLDRRLADPLTYNDGEGDPAALAKRSNELEGEITTIEMAWLEAAEEVEMLEAAR